MPLICTFSPAPGATSVSDCLPDVGSPPAIVCGDLSPAGGGDGALNVFDALRALKIAVVLITPDAREQIAGDVEPAILDPHGDGDIDVLDALRILNDVVGTVSITSCGGPPP